jgi:hypothetical protein
MNYSFRRVEGRRIATAEKRGFLGHRDISKSGPLTPPPFEPSALRPAVCHMSRTDWTGSHVGVLAWAGPSALANHPLGQSRQSRRVQI